MLPRRVLMNDKIVSAQGENLSLVNVKGSKLNALSVYGKSTQSGTPSPDNPVPIVSAGSVMTTGAQLFDIQKATTRGGAYGLTTSIDGETIKISGTVSSTPDDGSALAFRILNYPENLYGNTFSADIVDDTGVQDFYVYSASNENAIAIAIGRLSIGAEVNLVFRLMVNSGSTALPWEPYTGGIPGVNPYAGEINVSVSDGGTQSQTLTLSTPGGLPGIPVDSGGNYTDADGQQWVCDEVDFARGVYVQRVKKFVVTSDTHIDSMNPYATAALDVVQPFRVMEYIGQIIKSSAMIAKEFVVKSMWNAAEEAAYTAEQTIDFNILNERIGTNAESTPGEAEAAVREWLKDNPLTFLCQLITPIETDLPAEEIAAYKALHTYSPTTTVSNDAEAGVKIGYREQRR